jgi:hypothetical protein
VIAFTHREPQGGSQTLKEQFFMAMVRALLRIYPAALAVLGLSVAAAGGCSVEDAGTATDAGADAADAADADTGVDSCVPVSTAAASGTADTHCSGRAAPVPRCACCLVDAGTDPDAAVDAGTGAADADAAAADATACAYGATMTGQAGDDDDCKYHLAWSTTGDICESTTGATFSVTITNKSDGSPAANIPGGLLVETFVSLADGGCDDQSKHAGSNTGTVLTESPPGSGVYVGAIAFDTAGLWTLRFHIREDCTSGRPDSPHGTAAFHLTVH